MQIVSVLYCDHLSPSSLSGRCLAEFTGFSDGKNNRDRRPVLVTLLCLQSQGVMLHSPEPSALRPSITNPAGFLCEIPYTPTPGASTQSRSRYNNCDPY
ncbi:hypothetical protein XENTR_v10015702 [Xenopus tropicalis]|nr:hypothetical protein XENTR_v10015702 [Xenopus tropicalis]